MVEGKVLALLVERLTHHSNKKVQEEHAQEHDQHDIVNNVYRPIPPNRFLVDPYRIDTVPHHVNPPFRTLDGEKSDEGLGSGVEVQVAIRPFSAVIQTITLRQNKLFLVLIAQIQPLRPTTVKLAFEQCHRENGQEEDEEGAY